MAGTEPRKVIVSHNQEPQILPLDQLHSSKSRQVLCLGNGHLTFACMPLALLGLPHLSTQIPAPLGRGASCCSASLWQSGQLCDKVGCLC